MIAVQVALFPCSRHQPTTALSSPLRVSPLASDPCCCARPHSFSSAATLTPIPYHHLTVLACVRPCVRRLQQLQEQQLLVFLFHGSTLICCFALAKDAIAVLLLVTAACHSARLSLPRCTNPARNRHLHLSAGLEAALTALHSPASHLLLLLSSLRRGRGSSSASVHLPPDPVSRLTYRTHPRERSPSSRRRSFAASLLPVRRTGALLT